jgi:drug/metabolite transporter (DMT)-like permease
MAYGALALGILSIALSPIFLRLANAPGVVSAFYRMGIGALLVAVPFVNQVRKRRSGLPRVGVQFAVLGGILFSLDMYFWSTGVMMSGATIPTLLANTAPLWVGLGTWLFFRERQTRIFWMGLAVAITGASFALLQDLRHSLDLDLGALFGVFSAFFYGGYHVASQRGRVHLDTISYFWISTTVSTLCLGVYTLLLNQPLSGYDRKTWLLFLVMGILVQVLGWMFINFAHGHIPAAIVAPTMLAQPLLTALFARLLLGEAFTSWQLWGGLLVILGVFFVHRSRR